MWVGVDESGAGWRSSESAGGRVGTNEIERDVMTRREQERNMTWPRPGQTTKNETSKNACNGGMVYPSPSTTRTRKKVGSTNIKGQTARKNRPPPTPDSILKAKKILNQWFRSR